MTNAHNHNLKTLSNYEGSFKDKMQISAEYKKLMSVNLQFFKEGLHFSYKKKVASKISCRGNFFGTNFFYLLKQQGKTSKLSPECLIKSKRRLLNFISVAYFIFEKKEEKNHYSLALPLRDAILTTMYICHSVILH